MTKQTKKIIFCGILLFVTGLSSFAFAEEKRNLKVDREIGGMKEGSRIGAPKSPTTPTTHLQPTVPSSQKSKQAEPSATHSSTKQTETTKNHTTTRDNVGEFENKRIFKVDLEAEGVPAATTGTTGGHQIHGTGEIGAEEPTTGGTVIPHETESSDTTNHPIANTEVQEEPTTGGGITTPHETEPVETPSETASNNPIVDTEIQADLQSGTVETEVTLDTTGQLEEKQILDTNVVVEDTTSVEAETGSATDITEQSVVENADITTEPVTTVVAVPSDTSADVDTTGETTGGEADVGVEADVSGVSEGDDIACDPADALPSLDCTLPKL